jgi:hypothetical protein
MAAAITKTRMVVFRHPFSIASIGHELPAGQYRVDTDEEMIDGLSFAAYRRIATMMFLPAVSRRSSITEMVTIQPAELEAAQGREALLCADAAAAAPGGRA